MNRHLKGSAGRILSQTVSQKECALMSQSMLEELQRAWPGRVMLRADEVALVLRGSQTPDVVKRVRG